MKFLRNESKEKEKNINDALILALDVGSVTKIGETIKISCTSATIEDIENLKQHFSIDSLYGEKDCIIISLTLK